MSFHFAGKMAQRVAAEAHFPLCCDVSPCGRFFLSSYNGFGGNGCQVKVCVTCRLLALFYLCIPARRAAGEAADCTSAFSSQFLSLSRLHTIRSLVFSPANTHTNMHMHIPALRRSATVACFVPRTTVAAAVAAAVAARRRRPCSLCWATKKRSTRLAFYQPSRRPRRPRPRRCCSLRRARME